MPEIPREPIRPAVDKPKAGGSGIETKKKYDEVLALLTAAFTILSKKLSAEPRATQILNDLSINLEDADKNRTSPLAQIADLESIKLKLDELVRQFIEKPDEVMPAAPLREASPSPVLEQDAAEGDTTTPESIKFEVFRAHRTFAVMESVLFQLMAGVTQLPKEQRDIFTNSYLTELTRQLDDYRSHVNELPVTDTPLAIVQEQIRQIHEYERSLLNKIPLKAFEDQLRETVGSLPDAAGGHGDSVASFETYDDDERVKKKLLLKYLQTLETPKFAGIPYPHKGSGQTNPDPNRTASGVAHNPAQYAEVLSQNPPAMIPPEEVHELRTQFEASKAFVPPDEVMKSRFGFSNSVAAMVPPEVVAKHRLEFSNDIDPLLQAMVERGQGALAEAFFKAVQAGDSTSLKMYHEKLSQYESLQHEYSEVREQLRHVITAQTHEQARGGVLGSVRRWFGAETELARSQRELSDRLNTLELQKVAQEHLRAEANMIAKDILRRAQPGALVDESVLAARREADESRQRAYQQAQKRRYVLDRARWENNIKTKAFEEVAQQVAEERKGTWAGTVINTTKALTSFMGRHKGKIRLAVGAVVAGSAAVLAAPGMAVAAGVGAGAAYGVRLGSSILGGWAGSSLGSLLGQRALDKQQARVERFEKDVLKPEVAVTASNLRTLQREAAGYTKQVERYKKLKTVSKLVLGVLGGGAGFFSGEFIDQNAQAWKNGMGKVPAPDRVPEEPPLRTPDPYVPAQPSDTASLDVTGSARSHSLELPIDPISEEPPLRTLDTYVPPPPPPSSVPPLVQSPVEPQPLPVVPEVPGFVDDFNSPPPPAPPSTPPPRPAEPFSPTAEGQRGMPESPVTISHTVIPGDNLWNITRRYFADTLRSLPVAEQRRVLDGVMDSLRRDPDTVRQVLNIQSGNIDLLRPGATINLAPVGERVREQIASLRP